MVSGWAAELSMSRRSHSPKTYSRSTSGSPGGWAECMYPVTDLMRLILRLGLADLEADYPLFATDTPTHEVVLWSGRRPKRVVDSESAPPEFWAIAAFVDALGQEVDWVPVDTRRSTE